jgi:hypothetical protein
MSQALRAKPSSHRIASSFCPVCIANAMFARVVSASDYPFNPSISCIASARLPETA